MKKGKTKTFFYIKSQKTIPVIDNNKKIYHSIKDQNRKLDLYQDLEIVIVSRNQKIYHLIKKPRQKSYLISKVEDTVSLLFLSKVKVKRS